MDKAPHSPMGRRIFVGMCTHGITSVIQLARLVGVSHQTVRRWLYEADSRISAVDAYKLGEVLKLSSRWLVTGDGQSTPRLWVGPNEHALLLGFRDLDEDGRAKLMRRLAELSEPAQSRSPCPDPDK